MREAGCAGEEMPYLSLMKQFAPLILAALLSASLPATAGPFEDVSADIFILGEVHDNPVHHETQAEAIADINPRAVVYEMLTEAQARVVRDDLLVSPEEMADTLGWAEAGWPDFMIYYPVFAAARGVKTYGAAVPRDAARAAMSDGVAQHFGREAEGYGLTAPLDEEELAKRLNLQMEAHCGALPVEILPGMVELQRLRDASLARAAVVALRDTGGPVAVITGNGHARKDWGAARFIARVAPEARVVALGQSEDGNVPDGLFDMILDAPKVERGDPCAAFDQSPKDQ